MKKLLCRLSKTAICSFLLGVSLTGTSMATTNGTLEKDLPPASQHSFAGNLLIAFGPVPPGCPDGTLIRYASCSGSLIDVKSITNDAGLIALQGRLFLTAGHCTIEIGNFPGDSIVHFQNDAIRNDAVNGCRPGPLKGSNDGFHQYKVVAAWSGLDKTYTGLGVGQGKNDYGIILLDKVVLSTDVSKPALVAPVNPKLTVKNIPELGLAGYGLDGFGLKDDGRNLGKPSAIGVLDKMYVVMPTKSIQATNIISTMNAAQNDQTACNGDSGGGLFLPVTPASDGIYSIYGLVANGDFNCRATNTSTRVDTQAFRDYITSIAADIKAQAKENPPSNSAFPK